MIDPKDFLLTIIDPVLSLMQHDGIPHTDNARVMLLAIALQESNLSSRLQQNGPARGWWQFEGGPTAATNGVLTHNSTGLLAHGYCTALYIPADNETVFEALAWNDRLSATFARLLLWIDKNPLPMVGDANTAWTYYLRNWRPGKPDVTRWARVYKVAVDCVNSNRLTMIGLQNAAEDSTYILSATPHRPENTPMISEKPLVVTTQPEQTGARNSAATATGLGMGAVLIWLWNSLASPRWGLPEMPAEVGGAITLVLTDVARNIMPRTGALKDTQLVTKQ